MSDVRTRAVQVDMQLRNFATFKRSAEAREVLQGAFVRLHHSLAGLDFNIIDVDCAARTRYRRELEQRKASRDFARSLLVI